MRRKSVIGHITQNKMDQREKQEINVLTHKIIDAVSIDSNDFIKIFEKFLLKDEKETTIKEYLINLQGTLKKCTCQFSWSTDQLVIRCLDCQKFQNSCICVDCYLKGNHKGHQVSLIHYSNGCCDCGDSSSWSPSGFCKDHKGQEANPELTQLSRQTRIKIISICKACFHYCLQYAQTDVNKFNNIIYFLEQLASLGDATRRCVCISLSESFEYIDLYKRCFNFSKKNTEILLKFVSSFANDEVFRNYFSLTVYKNLPNFIKINQELALKYDDINSVPLSSVSSLFFETFHAYQEVSLKKVICENLIDWKSIFNQSIELIIINIPTVLKENYIVNSLLNMAHLRIIKLFKLALKIFGNKNADVIESVENFSEILIKNEFSYPFVRALDEKLDDPNGTQRAAFDIVFALFHFVKIISKSEIYSIKPLFLLKKFLNSPLAKDKIFTDDKDVYFKSVLDKNVCIAQTFVTHILSFCCLDLKEKKSLFEYIKEVDDDVETFIKKWSLLPLRWLIASTLSNFDMFVRNTSGEIISLTSFNYKKNIQYKFVPIFSLIQSLLKITSDVDNYLLMIVSIFGINKIDEKTDQEDFDDDKKRLILFSIFHLISCLIFDTMCAEKNYLTMRRLTIISQLMIKNMNFQEIKSIWFKSSDENFIDDLKSFTSRIQTKSGITYHLTDSSEWHPLLPHLTTNSIIPLIQNFIDANPDSFINFPKLPDDSKRFLFSPTLWALEYHILNHKSCKDYQIVHQLIINVLVITSNNSEEYYKDKKVDSNPETVIFYENFNNLVDQLKKLTFDQFLRIKIKDKSDVQKSMIDLIRELGNISIAVFERMNIKDTFESSEQNLQDKEEYKKKKNRERAAKLKKQIMNDYNKKLQSFHSTETLLMKTEKINKLECCICHLENDSDCLVYPALIFSSPLSSYIKWRFHNSRLISPNENSSISNDYIDIENIPSQFKTFNQIHICLHQIHSQCIKEKFYNCPTDRCKRNSSLPIVFDCKQVLKDSLRREVNRFVNEAYKSDLKFAIFSLASEIEIIEMRHRSNPNCLDKLSISVALRNIYLCIWHAFHNDAEKLLSNDIFESRRKMIFKLVSNEKKSSDWSNFKKNHSNIQNLLPDFDESISIELNVNKICEVLNPLDEKNKQINNEDNMTPLMKYILYSMQLEEDNNNNNCLNMKSFMNGKILPSSVKQNDSSIKTSNDQEIFFDDFDIIKDLSSEYQKLQFLRCAAIFDHFSRNKKITDKSKEDFIDWDIILSSSYLQNYYINDNNSDKINVDIDDELALPMFSLTKLPKTFLDFVHPPFSAPILNCNSGDLAICLFTGKLISLKPDIFNSKAVPLINYLQGQFNNSFSIFMKLNGETATQVFLGNIQFNLIIDMPSVYVDNFGDDDIGIKRGSLLNLNEIKAEEIIDTILSGSWTNKI